MVEAALNENWPIIAEHIESSVAPDGGMRRAARAKQRANGRFLPEGAAQSGIVH
jgi:hypothetical protein